MNNYLLIKEMEKRIKQMESEKIKYTDYKNFEIMMILHDELHAFVPNVSENGEVLSYVMCDKKDLIDNGLNEDYINEKIDSYIKFEKFKLIKNKLRKNKNKIGFNFTFKSNVKLKEYSDGKTIIYYLKKTKKIITMSMKLKLKEDYLGEKYFNSKEIIKKRAILANGKKNQLHRTEKTKNGNYTSIYINKKDLKNISRIELSYYNFKNEF